MGKPKSNHSRDYRASTVISARPVYFRVSHHHVDGRSVIAWNLRPWLQVIDLGPASLPVVALCEFGYSQARFLSDLGFAAPAYMESSCG